MGLVFFDAQIDHRSFLHHILLAPSRAPPRHYLGVVTLFRCGESAVSARNAKGLVVLQPNTLHFACAAILQGC